MHVMWKLLCIYLFVFNKKNVGKAYTYVTSITKMHYCHHSDAVDEFQLHVNVKPYTLERKVLAVFII